MNTILSINRFQYYIVRKVIYSKSQYMYILLTVGSIYLLALCMYILFGSTPAPLIKPTILATIIVAPCLFEPTIRKYNGIMEYTLPVSTFERFLYLVLRYVLLIPLITLGVYMLLNTIISVLPIDNITEFYHKMSFSDITFNKLYILFGLQSIYMLGELSFSKNSFLKTTLILIAGFIGFAILLTFIIKNIFINLDIQSPGEIPRIMFGLGEGDISWRFNLLKFTYIFLPVAMWIVSFFRIREKEI